MRATPPAPPPPQGATAAAPGPTPVAHGPPATPDTAAVAPSPAAAPPPAANAAPGGDIVESVSSQLAQRPVTYNKPTELTFGQATTVQVIINVGGGPIADQFQNLPGQTKTSPILVSREMSAELTGPADRVKIQLRPAYSAWQRLTTAGNPTWIWDVTALAPGSANLDLSLKAKVLVDGSATEQVIHTYHDTIPVRMGVINAVTWWIGRVDPIWKWAVGVVAALGGAYVWWRTNVARKKA